MQPDQLFLLAHNRAGVLPRVAQSFYLLEKQPVTTSAIWYSAYCCAGTQLLTVCASARTSKPLSCPHFIISFPSTSPYSWILCFCCVISASYSQSVPDLTTYLQLSCQLLSLETQVEKGFIFFFPPFCVKYSLHSYQAAWTECVSMANSSVTLVWHISKYPFLVPEDFLQPFLNPCCLSASWKSRKLEIYQSSGEGIL